MIPKSKRPTVKQKLAKKYWENNQPNAEALAIKFKVSERTGYRWIAEWLEDSKN